MDLNYTQKKVLELARANGGFIAAGHNVIHGCQYTVSARTLDALIKRGVGEQCYDGDGGYAMRLRPRGEWVGS